MRAVLLFSGLLHLLVIGALAAFALRSWLNANRPKEPTTPEFVSAAAALGLVVAVVGTLVSWMGRGFGASFTTGLVAGVLTAVAFMLTLGVLPHRRAPGAPPPSQYVRISTVSLVAAMVLTEVVAFVLMVVNASHVAPYL